MSALHKSESPLAGGLVAEKNTGDPPIVGEADGADKRFTTLRAQACIAGHELHRHDDGTFEARRWGWSRAFENLGEVAHWLTGVTGKEVA